MWHFGMVDSWGYPTNPPAHFARIMAVRRLLSAKHKEQPKAIREANDFKN